MALTLMYITKDTTVAEIAENAGVDRIFVDLEKIGKKERQGGMDTVQSQHTVEDVSKIRKCLKKAELLVRSNPIHSGLAQEIDAIITAGADIIMLPYFKTAQDVRTFVELVDGRAKTMPLVETPEAVAAIDDILDIPGIDEIYIGLNDLNLGYGKKFMFELLSDGTVERLCLKFKQNGIPYGFGGIAALGKGMLPSEYVIKEHYRLGSTCAILSRSFCNTNKLDNIEEVRATFDNGVCEIRELEKECEEHRRYFTENKRELTQKVKAICEKMQEETV